MSLVTLDHLVPFEFLFVSYQKGDLGLDSRRIFW